MDRAEFDERVHEGNLQEMFAAIGIVVSAASFVEIAAAQLYAALLGGEYGLVVALGQGFDASQQSCLQLAKARDEPQLETRMRDVLSRARDLYDRRSQVAHGAWAFSSVGGLTIRYRKWGKLQPAVWTHDELVTLAWQLTNVSEEIDQITIAVDPEAARKYRESGLPMTEQQ